MPMVRCIRGLVEFIGWSMVTIVLVLLMEPYPIVAIVLGVITMCGMVKIGLELLMAWGGRSAAAEEEDEFEEEGE